MAIRILAQKSNKPLGWAIRHTQAIGALQHRLSVRGTVFENEICNIVPMSNIGSGRSLRLHFQNSLI